MKTTKHDLSEKEMELVQLLMADCETTGDVQKKLKKLFACTGLGIGICTICIIL